MSGTPYQYCKAAKTHMCTGDKATTCVNRVDSLGRCLVWPVCASERRLDEEYRTHKTKPTSGQTRLHSMAETLTSIAVGFVVSMVLQALVLPLYGHNITLSQNFQITAFFTVASVIRGYWMRRFFNYLHTRSAA